MTLNDDCSFEFFMQEIHDRETRIMKRQRDTIIEDKETLRMRGERLNELHMKRDEILGKNRESMIWTNRTED